jgi:hypothetical protein
MAVGYKEAMPMAGRSGTIVFSGIRIILSFFAPNVNRLLTSNVTVTLHQRNTDVVVGSGRKVRDEKA